MNTEFPPLKIPAPQIADRRKEKGRAIPIEQNLLLRRDEIARRLVGQITPLNQSLHAMSEEERRAVFYKLEHEAPISLVGTDLKPLTEQSERFTLAVPKSNNLDKLTRKITSFGTGELKKGHAPNELLATRLLDLARGDPKDRLSEALFGQYENLVRAKWVICEIEMISLAQSKQRQREELQRIRGTIHQVLASGTNGNYFEHEEVTGTCRAVIRCTGQLFKTLVEGAEWQTRISWFDARPEFETFSSVLRNFSVDALAAIKAPSSSAPIVCIVDSGVTSGNPFLAPVSRDELLKSFLWKAPNQPFDEHGHGSGVASLAAYYALNLQQGAVNTGKVWVAGARILDANNKVEEERLFSKILEEVVQTFVPLGVRIFNLSVNVINRHWNAESKRTIPRQSWIARTIDRLSRERDIIFIVSTGNIQREQIRSFFAAGKPYPDYWEEEEAAILDPAQSALALTVGAITPGTLVTGPGGSAIAIAQKNQPAPFTRCGPGISREIKPEIVDFGGNYTYEPDGGIVRSNPGTDVMMASHQLTPAIAHDSGTSFASPRVAYKLALIMADLQALGVNKISAPLLKAFLVNSARSEQLGDDFQTFRHELETVQPNLWRYVVGYGLPDEVVATDCDPYSSLLFYQGVVDPDRVAYFDVPVPAALIETGNGIKRLTVTLVHSPEVQRWGLERYLGTTMKWRLFRGDVGKEEIIAAMSIEDGDAAGQPERPDELHGTIGLNLRSRGCVQHDIIEWSRHEEHFSAGTYTLAVAAYKKWQRYVEPIPYAVVIRLEDTTRTTQIYTEVQNILAQIEIRTQASR